MSGMISHHAFLLLADPAKFSATRCQQAIALFGAYDLSIPRSFIPAELDKRFGWPEGSAKRLLAQMVDEGLLQSLSRGRASSGGQSMVMMTAICSWSPKSLLDQWTRMEEARERVEFATLPR